MEPVLLVLLLLFGAGPSGMAVLQDALCQCAGACDSRGAARRHRHWPPLGGAGSTSPKFLLRWPRFYCRFNYLRLMRWARFWLHGDCGQEVERLLLLGIGSGRERERRLANSGARGAHGVAHDGGHMGEQASETHRRRSVRQLAAR